ncbi:MAG: hypothetical protein V4459_05705 [Pseudomonadota bacterium]
MTKLIANAGFGAAGVRGGREGLIRIALMGSTALVSVALASPAAAQVAKGGAGGYSDSSSAGAAGTPGGNGDKQQEGRVGLHLKIGF